MTKALTKPDARFCGAKTKQAEAKYPTCHRPAGWGTDHPGVGRCKLHGGSNPIKHGAYSKIPRPALKAEIEKAAKDANPLDMLPTLAKAKGILAHAVSEYETNDKSPIALADLTRAADTISKITFRIEQTRGMIPIDRVRSFMEQVNAKIDELVKDDATRKKLIDAIGLIRA